MYPKKNFLQFYNFLENSHLFAYEIEELNPLFIEEYDTIDDNLRTKSALNEIKYFKGDLGSKKDNLSFNELLKMKVFMQEQLAMMFYMKNYLGD